MKSCRWCGNSHPVSDLCRARRVSRRRFFYAIGAAAAAAALPSLPVTGVDSGVGESVSKGVLWRRDEGNWIFVAELGDIRMPDTRPGQVYGIQPAGNEHITGLWRRGEMTFQLNFTRT